MRSQFYLPTRKLLISLTCLAALPACTGQLPSSFRIKQVAQTFGSISSVNTKIDLLWVVDNSASMDTKQEKLRLGFSGFANKYMQPTWDIRVAVITTDTYMANTAFQSYIGSKVSGSTGWVSPYIHSRLATFHNPSYNPTLVNLATGAFDNGFTVHDVIPSWGANYGKLLPGIHDGPITALCNEFMGFFYYGTPTCTIRDNQALYTDSTGCVSPSGTQTATTQCVNTSENDVIHSGKAIISTMPPSGTPGDAAWKAGLLNNFVINVSTGTTGSGSERGMGSVQELLADNESTATAFFRPGSTRGIIFVSDEDDQTQTIPNPAPAGFAPFTGYACDQAGLIALNPAANITGVGGYCCSTPGNNCTYGSGGTTCAAKTVDGVTFTPSVCPAAASLIPVATIKSQLDTFFTALDGAGSTNPNYFVTSIVNTSGAEIQAQQTSRNADDAAVPGSLHTWAVDRGDRYIALSNLVGNGSLVMDIGATDYSPLLDSLGQAIINAKSHFTLSRAPTGQEDMNVSIIHGDGSVTSVASSQYSVSGTLLTLTDQNLVLSLTATDQVSVIYQPKTVF